MPHYMIWAKEGDDDEAYWVFASTPSEARQFVAMTVPEAAGADILRFPSILMAAA